MLGCESAATARDLALEAAAHFRVGRHVVGHDLQGDVASEPDVAGAVDPSHAARTERRDDFVLGEVRAWRQGQDADLTIAELPSFYTSPLVTTEPLPYQP